MAGWSTRTDLAPEKILAMAFRHLTSLTTSGRLAHMKRCADCVGGYSCERCPGPEALMPLTKQDIDALVDGMERDGALVADTTYISDATATWHLPTRAVRQALYKSAGLTASGERKPERVRCWSYRYNGAGPYVSSLDPNVSDFAADITPGWFVPDGAE